MQCFHVAMMLRTLTVTPPTEALGHDHIFWTRDRRAFHT